jgi:tetratricopeptide (TPR) repeat protein
LNSPAETYLSQAIAKYNNEDFAGAMDDLTQAIELDPNLALAYYYKGLSYNKINKVKCYQDFFKAVELDPSLVEAHCYVAQSYLYDYYEFDNAIEALNKALGLDPNHLLALSTMGDAYNIFAKFDKAKELYDKVIALDPNSFWAYFNRAHTKGNNKDFKGAFDDFSSAIGIDPSLYNTYFHRANIRHCMGDIEGAIADLTKSIELEPNYSTALYLRATLKADLSDFAGALKDINATIALGRGGDNHMYFIDRGIINLLQDRHSEAITDFNSVIKLNRKLPLTRLYRGIAKYNIGNKVSARADWKREGVPTSLAKSVMNNLKKIPFRFLINLRFDEESKESDFHYSNIKKYIDGHS